MSDLFSKPFALSIGPQACGTAVLRAYFKRRSDVILPDVEEVFFFDRHIHRGAGFYKSHFTDREEASLFMELSTTTFDHPRAPERIKELLGGRVKLFCLLRDPVERAVAVYQHYLRYGIVKGGFREACDQAPQILFASRYSDHLENWFAYFSDIHFISYEALQNDREAVIRDLCRFLDIPFAPPRFFSFSKILKTLRGRVHPGDALSPADMAWLQEQLEGEDECLKALFS
ncbi:MAG: sulfotransferase domain-containing protein [Alphaproteobacteria bacterium]